eukprot:TRINITY_DN4046_c0_g1_i2.p2 TRINITY_DN4046_c0_g1~~TRINITY_DN4046_c0_g1_i2.p2  ORF type:complete len:217 (-),score=33.51 TRINITY_DN4046_c0_g1_i2:276-926(-)
MGCGESKDKEMTRPISMEQRHGQPRLQVRNFCGTGRSGCDLRNYHFALRVWGGSIDPERWEANADTETRPAAVEGQDSSVEFATSERIRHSSVDGQIRMGIVTLQTAQGTWTGEIDFKRRCATLEAPDGAVVQFSWGPHDELLSTVPSAEERSGKVEVPQMEVTISPDPPTALAAAPPWECPQCGHHVSGGVGFCSKCATERPNVNNRRKHFSTPL